MSRYILKRLLIAIPILLGITFIVYMLSSMAPGGPLDIIVSNNGTMTQAEVERMKAQMGLDKPIIVQYAIWLSDILKGNLGISYRTNNPVISMIGQRIAPSLLLTLTAFVLAIIISIPLGIMAAYKNHTKWDYVSSGITFIATATPNFFLSLILIYLFSIKLGILPSKGIFDSSGPKTYVELIRHLILPSFIIAFQLTGSFIRYTRSSMLEVLNEDFIKTARSKGIKESVVVIKHGLRNALISIITSLGMSVPMLIGGAVVTEQVFSWPGIGSLMIQSMNARDYPTIMGITVLVATVVLLVNLVIDIIYSYLDPRISY